MGASFGLVDAMRVGEDNGPAWSSEKADLLAGPRAGSNRYFLHGRVWWNDPDPVYIRPTMPIEHTRLITSWVGLTGQIMTFSDWLPDMPAERVRILQRIIPNHGILTRPADYFDNVIPKIWTLTDDRGAVRRDVMGLFNWDVANESLIKFTPEKAGLPAGDEYVGFDFWADEFLPPFKKFSFAVPAGSTRIIAVRPASDFPMLISTNRHISQGIVDVRDEKWDGGALSGVSAVVGDEPYELRVAVPAGDDSWILKTASCGDPIVKVSHSQKGTEIRVTLESGNSVEAPWKLEFERGRVVAE